MPATDRLNDTALRKVQPDPGGKPRKLTDGEGMHLLITPAGGKLWRFDYRWEGRQQTLALGSYPEVSLKVARGRRAAAREKVANGIHPGEAAKATKAPQQSHLFEVICRAWLDVGRPDRSESHQVDIEARLENHVYPHTIGRTIESLDDAFWRSVFDRIYDAGRRDMCFRVRGYVTRTYRHANARGISAPDPTVGMDEAYPRGKGGHYPSVKPPPQLAVLLKDIETIDATEFMNQHVLWFASRLFLRPSELLETPWPELLPCLDAGMWRIPLERMKMPAPHFVPLAPQVVARFRALWRFTGHTGWVFASPRGWTQPISLGTSNQALHRLGYKGLHCMHGWRATASTNMHEAEWIHQAIERQLAHSEKERHANSSAAYNYAEYLDYRTRLMRTWANYLDALTAWKPNGGEPMPLLPKDPT